MRRGPVLNVLRFFTLRLKFGEEKRGYIHFATVRSCHFRWPSSGRVAGHSAFVPYDVN
jgi:hypothetical protein